MIRKVTMYQAVCDGCGAESNGVWLTKELAVVELTGWNDWEVINDKLYCPDCYEYDEEADEYKPKIKD